MQNQGDENIDTCGFCKAPASKKCAACKQISYCDVKHQKSHWKTHKINCRPFTKINDETKGRCVASSRDIAADEIIFTEEPLVIGPRFVSPDPVCLGCCKALASVVSSPKCAKCLWPLCDAKCSEINKFHKFECDFLASGKISIKDEYRYELIIPLRCLLTKCHDPEKWNTIMKMESHTNQRGPLTEVFQEADDLFNYMNKNYVSADSKNYGFSRDIFHTICGIIDVNALDVPYDRIELSALYPTFYLIEHSCLPNVKISFNKFKVKIRSAEKISRNEHLCTTYTSIIWGTQSRQQHLKSTKYFSCNCRRCADPTELGTHFSSVKCLQDNCTGYLLPTNPLKADSYWKCAKCGVTLPASDISDIISNLTYAVDQTLENNYPDTRQVEEILNKLETLLHPHHANCFSIKHSLIQLYGHQPGYLYVQLECDKLNRKIAYCKELLQILFALDPTQSRATLYFAVVYYELSAATVEVIRRKLRETLDVSLIESDYKEVRQLLNNAVLLLNGEAKSEMNVQLIQSCKNLYTELEQSLNEFRIVENGE